MRGRSRLVLVVAAGLALLIVAFLGCLGLRLILDPVPVELPPALSADMVFCAASDRVSGVPARGFWIDRFEVTVKAWREFQTATGYALPRWAMLWSDPMTGPGWLPATSMPLAGARGRREQRTGRRSLQGLSTSRGGLGRGFGDGHDRLPRHGG